MPVKSSRYLSPKLNKNVNHVIHRNAYFAHPENLYLAIMADYRLQIRELGLRGVIVFIIVCILFYDGYFE